jgi:hypothetical protein
VLLIPNVRFLKVWKMRIREQGVETTVDDSGNRGVATSEDSLPVVLAFLWRVTWFIGAWILDLG